MGKKSLEDLQKSNLPKATAESVGIEISGKDEQIGRRIFDKYFSIFVCPKSADSGNGSELLGSQKCVACDSRLDGMLGMFQWGLAHGEGNCCECGYLSRAIHQIKDENGDDFARLGFTILQYHPDELHTKEETTDADSL